MVLGCSLLWDYYRLNNRFSHIGKIALFAGEICSCNRLINLTQQLITNFFMVVQKPLFFFGFYKF